MTQVIDLMPHQTTRLLLERLHSLQKEADTPGVSGARYIELLRITTEVISELRQRGVAEVRILAAAIDGIFD